MSSSRPKAENYNTITKEQNSGAAAALGSGNILATNYKGNPTAENANYNLVSIELTADLQNRKIYIIDSAKWLLSY